MTNYLNPGKVAARLISMLIRNLIPVTLGNVIGGGFFVGCSACYIFVRKRTN